MQPAAIAAFFAVLSFPSGVVACGSSSSLAVVSIVPLDPGSTVLSDPIRDVVLPTFVVVTAVGGPVVTCVVVRGRLVVYVGVMNEKFIFRISGGKLKWMGPGGHSSPGDRAEGSFRNHGGHVHIN